MAPIVASDESLVHSVDKGRDKFAFHAKGNPLHACGWNLFPKKRQHFLSMSHYWLKKPPAKKKKTQEIVRFAPIPTDQNRLTVRLRDSLPNFVWSWVIRKRNSKPRAHKLAEVRLSTVWLGWVRDFAFFYCCCLRTTASGSAASVFSSPNRNVWVPNGRRRGASAHNAAPLLARLDH